MGPLAVLPVARPVIEQSIAFLAFISGIRSIAVYRHQMVLDTLCRFIRMIHFATTRPIALSPFNHLLLRVLWTVFIGHMSPIRLSRIKPLRTYFALKPSVLSVIMLGDGVRFHGSR